MRTDALTHPPDYAGVSDVDPCSTRLLFTLYLGLIYESHDIFIVFYALFLMLLDRSVTVRIDADLVKVSRRKVSLCLSRYFTSLLLVPCAR